MSNAVGRSEVPLIVQLWVKFFPKVSKQTILMYCFHIILLITSIYLHIGCLFKR